MVKARRCLVLVATVLTVGAAAAPATAQARTLRWTPAIDVTVTSVGAMGWIAAEVLRGELAPSRCRWCSVDSVDARVRDAWVWRHTAAADTLSDVTAFVLTPVTALALDTLAAAHDGATADVPEDTLLVSEATIVAEDVTQLTKLLVGRERPFVHVLSPDQKALTADPSGNLSFFSAHSSEAFAVAAASGTISELRGYRWAATTWCVGGVLAAMTEYLRIAADRHWLTDVVVGAVVGAGIGFAVPFVFHPAVDEPARVSAPALLRAPAPPTATLVTLTW